MRRQRRRLVSATGVVVDIDTAKSGTTTFIVEDASGRGRVVAFAAAGSIPDTVRRKATLSVAGIGGQRSTATGRLDGYRIWIRDGGDLQVVAAPSASPSPPGSASPSSEPSAPPNLVSIAVARAHAGQKVVVEGTVTSPAGLLDADDRRVTIEDGTRCHPSPSAGARDRSGRRQPRPGDGIDRHVLRRATALGDGSARRHRQGHARRACPLKGARHGHGMGARSGAGHGRRRPAVRAGLAR